MRRVVLDASALMTLFDDRAGAEKVVELIGLAVEGKRELLMSVVNWGEVYYTVWKGRGLEAAEKKLAEIAQLPVQIVDANRELTKLAAEFKAQYKLPYADCFAASLAKAQKAAIATSDTNFSVMGNSVSLVML